MLVITTILSMGDEDPLPRHRIFWGVCIGSVAAVLLMAGGLKALQTVLMAAALPVAEADMGRAPMVGRPCAGLRVVANATVLALESLAARARACRAAA